MHADGKVDAISMARLLAHFEAKGCSGVVLAGTNGEGPSLAAVEKRDLVREMVPLAGSLKVILGIATPSLEEAIWSSRSARKGGAVATLLMAPGYFREASEAGVEGWFRRVLDEGDCPTLVYNFPSRTGITLAPEMVARLADHPNFIGLKDSSGSIDNLAAYRAALPGKLLFVGDETILLKALAAGWTGTISGAANVVPLWLSQIVSEWSTNRESAEAKFELLLPVLKAIRSNPQPAANKAMVHRLGISANATPRLPLFGLNEEASESLWETVRGFAEA